MRPRFVIILLAAVVISVAGLGLGGAASAQPEPAGVEAASIALVKTVGLDPNLCAVTDAIALPPGGGEVTYCFEVENTGDVTLTLHDLDDSELGSIFSGLNYSLTPGASAYVTQTALIEVTTVNTATWTAYNPGGPSVTATDTATVTVEETNPAIALVKTVGLDPNVCAVTDQIALPPGGGEVTYCFEVENTGNVTLAFHDLDDSELGSIFSGLNYSLAPGASAYVTQTALIEVTTVNTATWTAYNPGGPSVTATDTATVKVATPAIALAKTVGLDPNVCAATDEITLPPGGGEVTYCFTVENTGDVTLTRHGLVDSELGTILSGLHYILTPGASAFVTQTALIEVTTVNTATWTADNLGGADLVTATDTAAVRVLAYVHLPVVLR